MPFFDDNTVYYLILHVYIRRISEWIIAISIDRNLIIIWNVGDNNTVCRSRNNLKKYFVPILKSLNDYFKPLFL